MANPVITSPVYIWSPNAPIAEHLRTVQLAVEQLMELHDMEPADIETSWRDDQEDEPGASFTGWRTIIKWPIRVTI